MYIHTHIHTHTHTQTHAQVRVKCEGFEQSGEWLYGIIRQYDPASDKYTIVLHAGYADVSTTFPSDRVQVSAHVCVYVYIDAYAYVPQLTDFR